MEKKENSADTFIFATEVEPIQDLADLKLPDPTLLDYYLRRQDRCILWNDEIEDGFVEIYQDIIRWNKEDIGKDVSDMKPIRVYINSDGGSVSAVFAIIDLLLMSKTPVITIGLGKCYSSGGLLLMAGQKRLMLPKLYCTYSRWSEWVIWCNRQNVR